MHDTSSNFASQYNNSLVDPSSGPGPSSAMASVSIANPPASSPNDLGVPGLFNDIFSDTPESPFTLNTVSTPSMSPAMASFNLSAEHLSTADASAMFPLFDSPYSGHQNYQVQPKVPIMSNTGPIPTRYSGYMSVASDEAQLGSRKRKSTTPVDSSDSAESTVRPVTARRNRSGRGSKTAHNMVEKKYRTKLNSNIQQLRDYIPTCRVKMQADALDISVEQVLEGLDDEARDELGGLEVPRGNLAKATILSKTLEYIQHLESRNDDLRRQNEALKRDIGALTRAGE